MGESFLRKGSQGTYEQWIGELHPENLRTDVSDGEVSIDHRFYIEGSDHLRLWNSRVDRGRSVRARTSNYASQPRVDGVQSHVPQPSHSYHGHVSRGDGYHTISSPWLYERT